MKRDRKKLLLLALLALLALSVVYRVLNPYRQQTVDRLTFTGRSAQKVHQRIIKPVAEAAATGGETGLAALLAAPLSHDGGLRRDIFSFRPLVKAAAVKPAPEKKKPETGQTASRSEGRPAADVPGRLQKLKIFGAFTHAGKTTLFLERGKEVMAVHEGDRIDGKYRVIRLTAQSLTLGGGGLKRPFVIEFEGDSS
jgi:hypothetical protein